MSALALLAAGCAMTPLQDRDWDPYLARLPDVERQGDRVSIAPVSDWSYGPGGPAARAWRDEVFDLGELERVWFVLEPQPGNSLAAHTFLLFEFADDRLVGLTIEARLEAEESFSPFRGLFNAYELAYLWGSARDLLVRRALYLNHDVYVYPLELGADQRRGVISRLLQRAEGLEARPRFYNTLVSNCTNELAKAVGLGWHYAFVFTGDADNHLFGRGLIPGESFEAARRKADMAGFIRGMEAREADGFDAALLDELRRRFDGR